MIAWCRYYCSRLLLVAVAGRPWLKLKVVRGVFHTTILCTILNQTTTSSSSSGSIIYLSQIPNQSKQNPKIKMGFLFQSRTVLSHDKTVSFDQSVNNESR